ncbi:MAG: OmpA family protein [Pseudomonadota bacterium]
MIKNTITALTVASLAMASAAVNAQEEGQWYAAPALVHFDDDEDRLADDGLAGAQLAIGKAMNRYLNIEGFALLTDSDGAVEQDTTEFGVNVLGVAARDSAFSPFILGGFSVLRDSFDSTFQSQTGTAMSIGAGFLWNIGDGPFSLRADYRLRNSFDGEEFRDRLATLGFQVALGDPAPRFVDSDGDGVSDDVDACPNTPLGAAVDARGCELDDDGDGVVNSKDACPNTPAGTRVDARGCAIPVDSDGDGVTDDKDQCPNTPAGARVDANGCELDDDGDGVVNSKDRCPNTAAGVRVDVYGCEIKEVINLPGVNFASNSDRLLPGSEQVLNDAAATLSRYPELVVVVAGHTDSDGAAEYNVGLSERRAKTVLNYLVERGANAANLSARGYGEAEPIADNSTSVGKAANRRVELRIQQ